jgi:hypothetical protein
VQPCFGEKIMTWDLGALILSSTVDLSGAKTDLNRFKDYVKQQTLDLSGYSNSIQALTRQINGAKITPQVDMSQLHELNKLYKIKKDDHDDLAGHVKRNPIKPIVDGSQLVEAIAQTQALKKELLSLKSNTATEIRFRAEHVINGDAFISKFERSAEKVGDAIAKRLEKVEIKTRQAGGGLFGLLTAPFKAGIDGIARGAFESIGKTAVKPIEENIAKRLTPLFSVIDKQVNNASKTVTLLAARASGYDSTSQFKRELGSKIQDLTDFSPKRVIKAAQKFEDNLVDVLESLYVDNDSKAAIAKAQKYSKEIVEKPIETHSGSEKELNWQTPSKRLKRLLMELLKECLTT